MTLKRDHISMDMGRGRSNSVEKMLARPVWSFCAPNIPNLLEIKIFFFAYFKPL